MYFDAELEAIMALTNPTVRRKLLESYETMGEEHATTST